jgi:hypothetical protein
MSDKNMRKFIDIVSEGWDTEKWWEPKLKPGPYYDEDVDPEGYFSRFGVPAEVENRYSNAQCVHLAYAMNERYGWPIKAEMMNHEPTHIAHAYCVLPDGREIDILGPQDKVDSFEGGPVQSFSAAEMKEWLVNNTELQLPPEEREAKVKEEINDARLAVELFIDPKVRDKKF